MSQSQRLNHIWENPDHIFSWKCIQHYPTQKCRFTGRACDLQVAHMLAYFGRWRHTLHRISSSQMQHLHNAWCAGRTQYAFPQSLEKKSRLIKLRWDSLPELAICDQTNRLNFFLSQVYPFRPSQQTVLKLFQKQSRKCKWAEPHDPENTTKAVRKY